MKPTGNVFFLIALLNGTGISASALNRLKMTHFEPVNSTLLLGFKVLVGPVAKPIFFYFREEGKEGGRGGGRG